MKKILSILCTLALVLGTVLIPGMLSASAAVTYLEPTYMQSGLVKETVLEKTAFGGTYGASGNVTAWGDRKMAFNFELEDNATYYIAFDFYGKKDYGAVRVNAADKYDAAPTKTGGSWINIGSTSGENAALLYGASDKSFVRYGMSFDTADIVTDECKYLYLTLLFNWTDTWISNITVTKAPANENGDIYPRRTQFVHPEKDGDTIIYTYKGWTSQPMFTFDCELKADATYKLTLDYFGNNRASDMENDTNRNWKVGAVSAATSYTFPTTGSSFASLLGKNNGDVWGTYTHEFTGAEAGVTDTNKYLALYAGYLIGNAKIRNIKLEVLDAGGSSSGSSSSGGNTSSDTSSSGGSSTPGSSANSPLKDPEFIYPTKLSGSATESADDRKVQKWDKLDITTDYEGGTFRPTYGWASGANTGTLVFDEILEADAEYVLEFDRYSKGAAADIVKIGTADAQGNADFTKSVSVVGGDNKTWSVYWHDGVSFKTSDVANGTKNRLAISMQSSADGCLLKNFRLTKVTRDSAYIYPSSMGSDMAAISENGNLAYSVTTYNFDNAWVAFDYELKADATYIIEFDYYGHNLIASWLGSGYAWRFGAASSADIATNTTSDTFNTKYVDASVPTNGGMTRWHGLKAKTYNHVARLVKGSDIVTDTNKYLVIYSKYFDCVPFLKNFKITEFSVKAPYMSPSNIAGSTEVNTEDNGDVSFGMYNSATTERSGTLTFDYQLDPDKTYVLKFQGIAHGEWKIPFGIGVTSGKDKADFESARPSLSGEGTKIPFPKSMKSWTPAGFMFKGSDLIVGDKKTLALKLNIYWSGEAGDPSTYQPTMVKNITVEEFTGDGFMHPVKYGDKTFVSLDGADIAYMNNYYDTCYMAYNFEVKPNTEYLITFDIKGCNTGFGEGEFGWSATAVADPYTVNFTDSVRPTTYVKLNAPNANRGKYLSHAITINGSDMGADATNKYLVLVKDGIEQHTYIKNFKIVEKPPQDTGSLFLNGTFENANLGTEFWVDLAGVSKYETSTTHTGTGAMHITAGDFNTISQKVDLEKNTTYELSFWYKGKVGGNSPVVLSRDVLEITRRYAFAQGSAPISVNDWTKCTLTFNTGNYTNVYVAFIAGPFSDYYVDDIKLCTTSAAAEWDANKLLLEPALLSFTDYSGIDHTLQNELTTYKSWTAAAGKNLFPLGDFENKTTSAYGDFIDGSDGVLSIVEGEGYKGTNALKFSAVKQDKNTTVWYYLDVKPYTNYFFTYKTRMPVWSQENIGDIRVGIANAFTGEKYFVYREETRGYRLACNDNEWHRAAVPFNSGPNTRVAISFTAANSTVYFDDIEIFDINDRVDDRSEQSKITASDSNYHPYITNEAPTKIYVGATKNLARNSTFEIADSKFWQKGQGYKNGENGKFDGKYVSVLDWNGIVEIKNTGTSRGNALYYKSQNQITGFPLGTSYIKYFDVEPNTEYTFVVDYVVTEYYQNPGSLGYGSTYKAADFGIAGATEIDMSVIKSVNIADAYNPNLVWQKLAVSFNTNGYDQLAFFIRDLGGAAYFDNISVFKSADGSTVPVYEPEPPEEDESSSGSSSSGSTSSGSTSSGTTSSGGTSSGGGTPVIPPVFVQGEIESDKYVVDGEVGNKTIYGVVPGTTVKKILDTLKNEKNIKAFDSEGNEVTDTSVPVGNGVAFRYMDGFSAVDAATVIVRGDLNGDGYIDAADMRVLMRGIINYIEMPADELMIIADIDEDGEITSHDIALISMHIGGVQPLAPVTKN